MIELLVVDQCIHQEQTNSADGEARERFELSLDHAVEFKMRSSPSRISTAIWFDSKSPGDPPRLELAVDAVVARWLSLEQAADSMSNEQEATK